MAGRRDRLGGLPFCDTEAPMLPLGGSVHLSRLPKLWRVVSYTPFLFLEARTLLCRIQSWLR